MTVCFQEQQQQETPHDQLGAWHHRRRGLGDGRIEEAVDIDSPIKSLLKQSQCRILGKVQHKGMNQRLREGAGISFTKPQNRSRVERTRDSETQAPVSSLTGPNSACVCVCVQW